MSSPYDALYGCEALLVREAGGTVTSLDGAPHRIETRTLIASNQECWGELQASLEAAGVVGLDPSVEEAEAAEAARAAAEAEAEAAAAAEAALSCPHRVRRGRHRRQRWLGAATLPARGWRATRRCRT